MGVAPKENKKKYFKWYRHDQDGYMEVLVRQDESIKISDMCGDHERC